MPGEERKNRESERNRFTSTDNRTSYRVRETQISFVSGRKFSDRSGGLAFPNKVNDWKGSVGGPFCGPVTEGGGQFMSRKETVRLFVDAINRHDMEALLDLMSEDHKFINSMGEVFTGWKGMHKGWREYFSMVPDYRVEISEMFSSGNTVVILGKASGTYTANGKLREEYYWEISAAWRAVVEQGQIKEWQVFADTEPLRKLIREESGGGD
jgi:ketosteroid isomerase-like protein